MPPVGTKDGDQNCHQKAPRESHSSQIGHEAIRAVATNVKKT